MRLITDLVRLADRPQPDAHTRRERRGERGLARARRPVEQEIDPTLATVEGGSQDPGGDLRLPANVREAFPGEGCRIRRTEQLTVEVRSRRHVPTHQREQPFQHVQATAMTIDLEQAARQQRRLVRHPRGHLGRRRAEQEGDQDRVAMEGRRTAAATAQRVEKAVHALVDPVGQGQSEDVRAHVVEAQRGRDRRHPETGWCVGRCRQARRKHGQRRTDLAPRRCGGAPAARRGERLVRIVSNGTGQAEARGTLCKPRCQCAGLRRATIDGRVDVAGVSQHQVDAARGGDACTRGAPLGKSDHVSFSEDRARKSRPATPHRTVRGRKCSPRPVRR